VPDVTPNVLSPDGRTPAAPGYDHDWFAWSPLPARPPVSWPGGARVAVSVIIDLGAVEWEHPGTVRVSPPGGRGGAPYPDFPRMSHREFGHRVGIFRVLESLRERQIPVAAAVDVLTVEHYRPLLEHLRPVVGEFLAGGLSASRPLTSDMAEDEERHYIGMTLDRLEAALSVRPIGWLGPGRGESARTPRLLAEAGLRYVADWCNDDQPYAIPGAGEQLWSFPLSWELSDLDAMFLRQVSPEVYARSLTEAVDVLCADGEVAGRMLGLHLHPWLTGQAFRADAVDRALAAIQQNPAVWFATPQEIVDWCRPA
jgi:allantoinase